MPKSQAVTVVVDDPATGVREGRIEVEPWWRYASEVLDHLRLPYDRVTMVDETTRIDELGVLVFACRPRLDRPTLERLEQWVRGGGAVLVVGEPGSLADVLGVESDTPVDHDHVHVVESEVWTQQPDIALHAVGGARLRTAVGAEADVDVLARWDDGAPAICARRRGRGLALACGVDLWQSIVRIQQGYPVTQDGEPAPDGTAPIDDGILKCEDGLALDFARDRALPPGEPELTAPFEHVYPPPSAVPVFHRPQADMWRSVFVQCVWWAAEQAGVPLPWLHYWPSGLPAVAHLSHDSDNNQDEHARAALDTFAEADVRVTWCQVFPGGYAKEIYGEITAAGHEQALHYNAMHDADLAEWGWPQMRAQYAWAQAVSGTEHLVSNKNHYTRWEGFTEFYEWCEQLGVQIDQSRGPSKQGSVGFLFGTAHVSFPMADAGGGYRSLDVLNLPLHTQDLAWAGHESNRDVILDGALEQHGVAHFLFHGPHLHLRPPARKACLELAREVRRRGMAWWTSAEINHWERLRRRIELSVTRSAGDAGWVIGTEAAAAVPGAAVLLLLPGRSGLPRLVDGAGELATVRRHGREFVELTVDIPAGEAFWTLAAA